MTPYQELTPYFDTYNKKITEERNKHSLSLTELSEKAGVSYSSVATQSADNAPNPKLFEQAAICSVFGLSLDKLCGLPCPADVSELTDRIHELEIEKAQLAGDVRRLTEVRFEKDNQLHSYRLTLYTLVSICVILAVALSGYMIFDASITTVGLFQTTGISILAAALILAVFAAVIVVFWAVKNDVAWNRRLK